MNMGDKKFTCVQAETGTLIFAVFNLLSTATSSILSAVAYNYWAIYHLVNEKRQRTIPHGDYEYSMNSSPGCVLSMAASFTALTFAVFLLHGVIKQKPEYIRAYYIYGVVVTTMSVMAALSYMAIIEMQSVHDFGTVAAVLIICFLFMMILRMIRITYKTLEAYKIKEECCDKIIPI